MIVGMYGSKSTLSAKTAFVHKRRKRMKTSAVNANQWENQGLVWVVAVGAHHIVSILNGASLMFTVHHLYIPARANLACLP